MKKYLILSFLIFSTYLMAQINKPLFLSNKEISVGILPYIGGRIVFFGTRCGENLLKSDSTMWIEEDRDLIKPSPFSDFKAYNGFITWIGPQSEWWTHQSLNFDRFNKKSNWPPDPYLIYGAYQITSQTDSSTTLIGPPSPISGIQFYKTYCLKDNSLYISISAKNITNKKRGVDIWANTRFEGFTKHMTPASSNEIKKIEVKNDNQYEGVRYCTQQNMFSFIPEFPTISKKERSAKAYLNSKLGEIYVFKKNYCLLMSFDPIPIHLIHPEHAFIEIYNRISHDPNDNLLELEHHSPYKILEPGDKINLNIKWTLFVSEKPFGKNDLNISLTNSKTYQK